MNYQNYTLEELKEEMEDTKRVYEQDKEAAMNAQKYLAKSELAYYGAKINYLIKKQEKWSSPEDDAYESARDKEAGI